MPATPDVSSRPLAAITPYWCPYVQRLLCRPGALPRLQQTLSEARLRHADPDPGRRHPGHPGRPRSAGRGSDRYRQNRRLRAATAGLLMQQPQQASPRPIRALVLVPTRELAVQVAESVERYGQGHRPCQRPGLRWGQHSGPGGSAESRGGSADRHPGPVARPSAPRGCCAWSQLEYLVFDEADRMLDMGFMDGSPPAQTDTDGSPDPAVFGHLRRQPLLPSARSLLRDPERSEVAQRNTTAAEVEQRVYAVDSDRKGGAGRTIC